MKANFEPLMREVLRHEGGFSDDPKDPGNWTGGKVGKGLLVGTKYGIAANTFPNLDIRNLTFEKAVQIYRGQYADPIHFDVLPSGVDWAILDPSINSGVKRAVIFAQQSLGLPEEDVDGALGPKTLGLIQAAEPKLLIRAICRQRLMFMRGLSTWGRYGNGWTNRVNEVQAKALAMSAASAAVA